MTDIWSVVHIRDVVMGGVVMASTETRRPRGASRLARQFLFVPANVLMLLFLVVPMVFLVANSLEASARTDGSSLWANFELYFSHYVYYGAIVQTIKLSGLATLASVITGTIAAYFLRSLVVRLGSLPLIVLILPLIAGPMVTVLGWMSLTTSSGVGTAVYNSVLRFLSLGTVNGVDAGLLGTDAAVILAMTQFAVPFVVLNVFPLIQAIDPDVLAAAKDLGAGSLRVAWQVVRPLAMPGIYSAAIIAFSVSLSSFLAPLYLGNRSRPTLTVQISTLMGTSFDENLAATASVVLLALEVPFLMLYIYLNWRMSLAKGVR